MVYGERGDTAGQEQSRIRFDLDTMSNLAERIEDMEFKMIGNSWLERWGKINPSRVLNRALMTAKIVYAKRRRDFEEADRLSATLAGIEVRLKTADGVELWKENV